MKNTLFNIVNRNILGMKAKIIKLSQVTIYIGSMIDHCLEHNTKPDFANIEIFRLDLEAPLFATIEELHTHKAKKPKYYSLYVQLTNGQYYSIADCDNKKTAIIVKKMFQS